MSETLVSELLRYCKSTYGIDLCSSSGAKAVLRAELCLLKCLVCLGRAAMQQWFKQIGKGHKGQRAEKKGVLLPASAGFHNPPTSISAARHAMMPE